MPSSYAELFVRATTAAWALLGVLGAIPAMFSVMLFDAPGSEANPAIYVVALGLVSFPLTCFVSVFKSRQGLRNEVTRKDCLWALLPIVSIAIGGAGLAWLEIVKAAD